MGIILGQKRNETKIELIRKCSFSYFRANFLSIIFVFFSRKMLAERILMETTCLNMKKLDDFN
jgi:hypothetical protein